MLTQARAREVFEYNEKEGYLIWKCTFRKGDKARQGQVYVDGRRYMVHRVVWLIVYGQWPGRYVRHRNGKLWDNRIGNLTIRRPKTKPIKPNAGITGVHTTPKGDHIAYIRGKQLYRGDSFSEAVYHRYCAEQCLNFSRWESSPATRLIRSVKT